MDPTNVTSSRRRIGSFFRMRSTALRRLSFVFQCSRGNTMRHRILAWVGALVGGTIVLILISLLVITRSAAKGTDIGPPDAADTLPPAGLPGTTDAPAPKLDTTVAPEAQKHDPNEVI